MFLSFSVAAFLFGALLPVEVFALIINVLVFPAFMGLETLWLHFKAKDMEFKRFRRAEIEYGTAKNKSVATIVKVSREDVDTEGIDMDCWIFSDFRNMKAGVR